MSRAVKGGTVDFSTVIRIVDSTDGTPEQGVTSATAGLALWYRREGGTLQALTESDLATLDAAHSDGGMLHIDDGYYRVDLPDAAVAVGAGGVLVAGAATGMVVIAAYHPIDEPVDAVAISGDATAADNLEAACDNYSATRGLAGTALPAVAAGANAGLPLQGYAIPNADAGAAGGLPTSSIGKTGFNDPAAATVADAVWDELVTGHDGAGKAGAQLWTDVDAILAAVGDIYHADIFFTRDQINLKDEYTVVWFKNGAPVTAGITGTPQLQVVKRADGTNLIAATNMTVVGATTVYKLDDGTNRLTLGEAAIAIASATIDAVGRTWRAVVGRDST